jgi:Protein of unknown function (DUF1203)
MKNIRVVAIATEVAEEVRKTMRSPVYGFPAHAEMASGTGPCRHCLRTFTPSSDRRILFTYDRFTGVESLPQPGPVYIHAEPCEHYDENAGFPEQLRDSPRTLEAYAHGRILVEQAYVADGNFEPALERFFERPDVHYVQVQSTTAGCFTFRLERVPTSTPEGRTAL